MLAINFVDFEEIPFVQWGQITNQDESRWLVEPWIWNTLGKSSSVWNELWSSYGRLLDTVDTDSRTDPLTHPPVARGTLRV